MKLPFRRALSAVAAIVIAMLVATGSLTLISSSSADALPAGTTVDGSFSGSGLLRAGTVTKLRVAGRGGVPTNNTAVALNVTATQSTNNGWAVIYACGTPRPLASNINFQNGTTIANTVLTKTGTNGDVCIYTNANTHFVVDVNGYFTNNNYKPLTSARLLDTRPGNPTVDGSFSGSGLLRAGTVTKLRVAGRGGVPTNNTAVALNVTATQSTNNGWAVIYACGTPRPLASNINFQNGTTIANTVLTKTGTNGDVCIYTNANTHFVVDVNGYFTNNNYKPLTSARLLDTRPGNPTVDGSFSGSGLLRAGTVTKLRVAGRGGVPTNNTAVALNVTATQSTNNGWAVIYACGTPRPLASNINFQNGTTIANTVLTKTGTNGDVCIYTNANTHFVVDVNGYFTNNNYKPLTSARLLDTRPASLDSQAEDYSLLLLNELRTSLGLQPLVVDSNMSAFAGQWSQTMAQSGFGHSGGPWAENIVWWSPASFTPEQAAEALHKTWVESPPHYVNMTNPNWSYVGIGIYQDATGWYGTQEFR